MAMSVISCPPSCARLIRLREKATTLLALRNVQKERKGVFSFSQDKWVSRIWLVMGLLGSRAERLPEGSKPVLPLWRMRKRMEGGGLRKGGLGLLLMVF